MKERKILLGFLIFISIFSLIFLFYYLSKKENKKYVLAVCPTYYDFAGSLDEDKYQIKKTGSTAESLSLLEGDRVDMVITGRPVRPNEGLFDTHYISNNGFSFLSKEQIVLFVVDFDKINFCTDLDNTGDIQRKTSIKNIYKIKDIMECNREDIVITSWDNTDYSFFEPAQILNSDRSRYHLSRTPIVHCRDKCQKEVVTSLKNHYNSLNN